MEHLHKSGPANKQHSWHVYFCLIASFITPPACYCPITSLLHYCLLTQYALSLFLISSPLELQHSTIHVCVHYVSRRRGFKTNERTLLLIFIAFLFEVTSVVPFLIVRQPHTQQCDINVGAHLWLFLGTPRALGRACGKLPSIVTTTSIQRPTTPFIFIIVILW